MTERWKACPGFEKHYQVSNLGRVRRVIADMGTRNGKILKPWLSVDSRNKKTATKSKREIVSLSVKCRITKKLVSRLVCEAFYGKPPTSAHQAAHWDGNSLNNKASNLRWATQAENEADKIRHGRYNHAPSGSKHVNAKLHETDIPVIRNLKKSGLSNVKIGKIYGVDNTCIRRILAGRGWKHV